MIPSEIQQFSEVRAKARAYFCYMLQRSIPNFLPDPSLDVIVRGLKNIEKELPKFQTIYVLDSKGVQVIPNLSKNPSYRTGKGVNRSSRAFYYRVAREKKCIITNPYPSVLSNELVVTAAYPVYDDQRKLRYIVCIDISLHDLLQIARPTSLEGIFHIVSKVSYSLFSAALLAIAFLLFLHGMLSIFTHGFSIEELEIKQMFEATILITLSLAIFDLVKTIFEEEVLGHHLGKNKDIHRTMIRFLGSIVIALSIEALMLVFKFAIMSPDKIKYAVLLIGGVAMLLLGLAYYLKSTESREKGGD